MQNVGLKVFPAAYAKPKPNAKIIGSNGPGQVPKDAGIAMIVSLIKNAAGERRLFLACDDLGNCVAPKLLKAIETQERDSNNEAETKRKGEGDDSHYTAALRYALWRLEAPKHLLGSEGVG
jgi:hypothetical protein